MQWKATCIEPDCPIHPRKPKVRRRRTYDTGFRDGVFFAALIEVAIFIAVACGYLVGFIR